MHAAGGLKVLTAFALSSSLAACGIIIGNPSNPVDDGQQTESVQSIDYDIPTSVSSYELAPEMPDAIFDDSVRSIDGTIDRGVCRRGFLAGLCPDIRNG